MRHGFVGRKRLRKRAAAGVMNNTDGICIEIDGIYCPRCHDLHPTLMWHNKYSEYMEPEHWMEQHRKSRKIFGISASEEEIAAAFKADLDSLKLMIADHEGSCVACGCKTKFQYVKTGHYVCSDECKRSDGCSFSFSDYLEEMKIKGNKEMDIKQSKQWQLFELCKQKNDLEYWQNEFVRSINEKVWIFPEKEALAAYLIDTIKSGGGIPTER